MEPLVVVMQGEGMNEGSECQVFAPVISGRGSDRRLQKLRKVLLKPTHNIIFEMEFSNGKELLARQNEGLGKLIGAGGGSAVAAHAAQPCDDVFALHALDQSADALEVAVAAAGEDGGDEAVFVVQHDVDGVGAGADAIVVEFFHGQEVGCFAREMP